MDKRTLMIAGAAAAIAVIGLGVYLLTGSDEEEKQEKVVASPAAPAAKSTAAPASAPAAAAPAAAPAAAAQTSGPISKAKLLTIMEDMIAQLRVLKAEVETRYGITESNANDVDEEKVQAMLGAVMEGVQEIEKEVQNAHGINQQQLMEAQEAYATDPEVRAAMTQLKEMFFGEGMEQEIEEQVPEGMTADKFHELFKQHLRTVEEKIQEIVLQVKAQTRDSSTEQREAYFQMVVGRSMEEIMEGALAQTGLDDTSFRACMLKYQADPRFMTLIMESNQKQSGLRTLLHDTSS